uniref:Uncharacterized protein n=1 Tax=Arundo donax TaxID=35708 RepID=A0A0A9HED0_ARUDO
MYCCEIVLHSKHAKSSWLIGTTQSLK